LAKEAEIMPLPKEEVTPPVTKIYLVIEKGPPKQFLKLQEVVQTYHYFETW
jgi:hypothetical protein